MIRMWAKNQSVIRRHQRQVFEALVREGFAEEPPATPVHDEAVEFLPAIRRALQEGMDFAYVLGTGDGEALASAASELEGNRGMLVIEPNAGRLARVMVERDLAPLFRSGKIFWAVGEEARDEIGRIFEETLCFAAGQPRIFVLNGELRRDNSGAWQAWLEEEIRRRKEALMRQLKELPERMKHEKTIAKPRVWGYEDLRGKQRFSLIQYTLIRTIFYELRRRGYKTQYTVQRDGCYYPPYYRLWQMARFAPHLVFLCNAGPRFEFILGEEVSRSLPVPKVVWYADDPIHAEHLLERHRTGEEESYFVADYKWEETLRRYGAQSVSYLPGAATRSRRGAKRKRRACEIVFVGQVRDQSEFFARLPPAWREYARRVIEEKLRFPRKNLREVLEQFVSPERLAMDWMDELKQKLLWEANTRFRVQVVKALMDLDIRIYGNEAWRKFLSEAEARRCFRGVLARQDLFEVYRNSRITLNIHSLQTYTCMNVRDFDVPAAGGFLISDWLPRAEEIYQPGFVSDLPLGEEAKAEVFFYRSLAELRQLTAYFLNHEEERRTCSERAREKVIRQHTYAQRVEMLDRHFRERLVDCGFVWEV